MICNDNGTNFVGANIELRKAFNEMNHTKINNFCNGTGRRMDYLETKSPYGKQYGRILGVPNLLSSKYTQLIVENSRRKPK